VKHLVTVVLVAGCGGHVQQRPLTYLPTHLEGGHYQAVSLRSSTQPDQRLDQDSAPWTLDIDRDALQITVTGPEGPHTRRLTRVPDDQQPAGCLAGGTMSRMETFSADGPLTILSADIARPLVVASCPNGDRIIVRDAAAPAIEVWFATGSASPSA
jgi:hypothetical protein